MDFLFNAFKALIDAGSYVMLPIIITVIGLIFRLPISKAFKSGITITCGFVGINLLVNLLKSAVSPAAAAMVENFGLTLDVTDVGWGAISSVTWASPIVAFLVFEILGINILMLVIKATKTMDVDIWNYHHMMIAGILVYYVTENIVWALIATAMTAIMTLKFADWTAPLIEHFFGIPDVTLPTISYTSSIIVAAPINWVIDRIPGLNKVNFNIKSVQKYLGLFGDPMMLGLILGIAMGALAMFPVDKAFLTGVNVAVVTFRVALVVALCRGNVFRSILICIPVMSAILYAGTFAAPYLTGLAQSTGLTFDGQIASMAGPSLTQTAIVFWSCISQNAVIVVPVVIVVFAAVWFLVEKKIGMEKIEAYAAQCDEQ